MLQILLCRKKAIIHILHGKVVKGDRYHQKGIFVLIRAAENCSPKIWTEKKTTNVSLSGRRIQLHAGSSDSYKSPL